MADKKLMKDLEKIEFGTIGSLMSVARKHKISANKVRTQFERMNKKFFSDVYKELEGVKGDE